MSERDKLVAKPDGLEILDDLLETCEMNGMHAEPSYIAAKMMHKELRALASQQPVDEPVYVRRDQWEKVRNHPFLCRLSMQPGPDTVALYTHPQASAPVDHQKQGVNREFLGRVVRMVWVQWAREQPNPKASWLAPWEELTEPEREVDRRIGEKVAEIAIINGTSEGTTTQTAPTETDLDALVAALGYQKQIDEDGTFVSVSRQAVDEAGQAITDLRSKVNEQFSMNLEQHQIVTDLRAQVATTQKNFTRCANDLVTVTADRSGWRQTCLNAQEHITRLEADNAEARGLLDAVRRCGVKYGELQNDIEAFLAKGATP